MLGLVFGIQTSTSKFATENLQHTFQIYIKAFKIKHDYRQAIDDIGRPAI